MEERTCLQAGGQGFDPLTSTKLAAVVIEMSATVVTLLKSSALQTRI